MYLPLSLSLESVFPLSRNFLPLGDPNHIDR